MNSILSLHISLFLCFSRLQIGQTTLYSSELEKVEGRKVFVRSKVTCSEERIVYSEASALFLIVNNLL